MRFGFGLLAALLAFGCAKSPSGGIGGDTTRILITMTVAGEINPNYIYIVALRTSEDTTPTEQGPIPVVSEPWGNGFVAGNATHFVQFDPLFSPDYLLFRFQDPDLLIYNEIGSPINFDDVPIGGRTISFELDINQIADSEAEADLLMSMQVNLLTMDRAPRGTDPGPKTLDALGDTTSPSGIDDYVLIPLNVDGTYTDAGFANLEPTGDCPDPDLDIVDWSIEVRRP